MKTWKILASLTVAIALPASYFLHLNSQKPDPIRYTAKRFAQNTGLNENEAYRLFKINEKMHNDEPLSEQEFSEVETASKSSAMEFRVNSLDSLRHLEATPFKDRAHSIMRHLTHDPEPGIRSIALRTLTWVKDPETVPLLKEAIVSSDPYVKPRAEDMLKKYIAGSK